MDGRRPPCEQLQEPGLSAFSLTSWEQARGCLCGSLSGVAPWTCLVRVGHPVLTGAAHHVAPGPLGAAELACGCRRQGSSDRGLGQGRGAVADVGLHAGSPHGPESRSVDIAVTVKSKVSPLKN